MDFDDTWHPATHPSGAVLPVLMALTEAFPSSRKFSGLDLLLAFNVGIEVQGQLMHFSKEASDIPKRYGENLSHPEADTFPLHLLIVIAVEPSDIEVSSAETINVSADR